MSCGRLAAVMAGIILLFPGLCFVLLGTSDLNGPGLLFLAIGLGCFGLAGWLIAKVAREPEPPSVTLPTREAPKEQEPPKTE